MKKLTLDLVGLKVESFDTFVPEDKRGTVRANSGCVTYSCPPGTCGAQPVARRRQCGRIGACGAAAPAGIGTFERG